MAWYTLVLPVTSIIIGVVFFVLGFILVYRSLRKVNLIEGEQFTYGDWLLCIAFGCMFGLVVMFATSMTFDIITPENIPTVAGYALLVLLGILLVYPLWEAIFLGRPTADAVNDYHKFVENKVLDRFRGKSAYLVSAGIFLLVYIMPIILLSILTPFEPLQIAFVWFLIFPLFFLNYFSASGQVSNIIGTKYRTSVKRDLYPSFPNPISKVMGLIFLVIAWLPFIISIYGIYSPINLLVTGGSSGTGAEIFPGFTFSDLASYLSLFTTVVFGIQGFFKKYWKKKSKTKTIDFIFAGYIFIGIGVNMLINFSNIDRKTGASVVNSIFQVSLFGWKPLEGLKSLFENPAILLPVLLLQGIVTVTYGTYLLFNKKSDFHADIRLSAVNHAFGITIDQLVLGDKFGPDKQKAQKFNLPLLFKSALLHPVYAENGADLNQPVRQKAAQFLFLAAINNRELAVKIVDIILKKTVEKDKNERKERKERVFISKEAVDMLGLIGKQRPDLVTDRLMDALESSDVQIKRFILDAIGDIAEAKTNLEQIIVRLKPLLIAPRYDVRIAAFSTLTEAILEGEFTEKSFVEMILDTIYEILETKQDNPEIIDTALDALLDASHKVAEFINIDKILPFLEYSRGENENIRSFIVENTISILGYTVYYNLVKFPLAVVLKYLKDPRNHVRYVAVDAIGNYILKSGDDLEREAILKVLLEMSLNDPDPDVTEICRESISELLVLHPNITVYGNSVLSRYSSALNASESNVQENASEALKVIAPFFQDNIYPLLLEKMNGDNPELTRDCLHILGIVDREIQLKVNLEELYAFIEHDDATIRAEAIFALGGLSTCRPDVNHEILFTCLDDKDPEVRLQAIFALGKLGLQKPEKISEILIRKFFYIDRESSSKVSEVELYAESLGIIGEVHPSNEIIISLQQALMGDTNVFAKDIIAKGLGRIGNGMIRSGNATRIIEDKDFYNAISWLQISKKKEYTIGNLIIIFIEALQQKGIPASVMNIISDSIQDLLPVFAFVTSGDGANKDKRLLAIKDLLAQAYYANFNQEILETIDRCDSLINFRRIFDTNDPAIQEQYEFYSKQYTPDGKQFHDQGVTFMTLSKENEKYLDYALRSFDIAVELSPNEYYTPDCYYSRGVIYKKRGNLQKAKEELTLALEAYTVLDEIESMKKCEDELIQVKIQIAGN
ncbi:MAG: HEAT repeat domain-containing protein [Promethearchaeota archaeon]